MTLQPAVLRRATRAYSLPASVVPVLLGTVLAFRGDGGAGQGHFDGTLFLVVLLGSILAHFGANVLNDYFDFILGVDTRPEHGSGVLTGDFMTAWETLVFGVVLLGGAAGCGLFVGLNRIAVVVPLALLGLGCAVLKPRRPTSSSGCSTPRPFCLHPYSSSVCRLRWALHFAWRDATTTEGVPAERECAPSSTSPAGGLRCLALMARKGRQEFAPTPSRTAFPFRISNAESLAVCWQFRERFPALLRVIGRYVDS